MTHDTHKIQGPEAIVAGSFQIQQQLPNGRSMSVSGYVFQGEPASALQSKVDMIMGVLDETRGKAELPELEHKLHQIEQAIDQHTTNHAALIKARDAGQRITSTQKQSLETFDTNLSALKSQQLEGLRKIQELRAKYGIED